MLKKLLLTVVILAALLVYASPALAQGTVGQYYVDTTYTGTSTGSATQPFKTLQEAITAAQNNPAGGHIYTRASATSAWVYWGYVSTVVPPDTGSPVSGPALFGLLALVSLGLIAGGWLLLRRSRARAQLA